MQIFVYLHNDAFYQEIFTVDQPVRLQELNVCDNHKAEIYILHPGCLSLF